MQTIGRQPHRAPDGAPLQHDHHRPEQTTLYRQFQQRAASFIARTETSTSAEMPRFTEDEFDCFLDWGTLAHGFLLLRCGDCGYNKLLAFSCKRSGFCPSCGARRMSAWSRGTCWPALIQASAPTEEARRALLQTTIARLIMMLTHLSVRVQEMGQTCLAEPDAGGE